MKFFFIIAGLVLALFLETSTFSLPLVLLLLLLFAVLIGEQWILIVAFFTGILLDILSLRIVGSSSIFFLLMLGGVFLYQRKYEIQSIPFIMLFSCIATLLYGFLFREPHIFGEAIVCALLAGGVFFFLSKIQS